MLGDLLEAEAELDRLDAEARTHPEVLAVRYEIHMVRRDWVRCFEIAQHQLQVEPGDSAGWIHGAYALRRMPGGGLEAAYEALLPAVKMCPKEPVVVFNLACYACQLGLLEEAWEWLGQAVKLSTRAEIVRMALADDDLEPLRARLKEL